MAIVAEKPTTSATKNTTTATRSSAYPVRVATAVQRATCARRRRMGSSVTSLIESAAWYGWRGTETTVTRRTGVLVVTLDRPERRNAVDHATLVGLLAAQREAAAARVLVLTGAPPAFSAGADLTGVEEGEFAALLGQVLRGFGELPIPTIAAVDGPALGAGTQLAVACDLRVATPAAASASRRRGSGSSSTTGRSSAWRGSSAGRSPGRCSWPPSSTTPPRCTRPAPCTASAISARRWRGPASWPAWRR